MVEQSCLLKKEVRRLQNLITNHIYVLIKLNLQSIVPIIVGLKVQHQPSNHSLHAMLAVKRKSLTCFWWVTKTWIAIYQRKTKTQLFRINQVSITLEHGFMKKATILILTMKKLLHYSLDNERANLAYS